MSITFLDGALGSILMEGGGESVTMLNLHDPERVLSLHKEYISAGSEIICSNTFSANRYGIEDTNIEEIICAGVRIARRAVEESGTNTKVALDIGPLSELLEPYGDLEEEDCAEQYRRIIDAGKKEGPDLVFFETFMDIDMLEIAIKQACDAKLPFLCSMSFTEVGRTIMGHSVEQMCERLLPYKPIAIGMNCSMEPDKSIPIATEFRKYTDLPIIFKPNAGKPIVSSDGVTYEDASMFAAQCRPIVQQGKIFVGGCCGSTPEFIVKLRETMVTEG